MPLEAVEGSYLAAAHGALLGGLAMEPLVVGLSDGYELCRWVVVVVGVVVGGWGGKGGWKAEAGQIEGGHGGREGVKTGAEVQLLCFEHKHSSRHLETLLTSLPSTPLRLIESDAAALAGRPATWVPPDRFQRVTRSERGLTVYWTLELPALCRCCYHHSLLHPPAPLGTHYCPPLLTSCAYPPLRLPPPCTLATEFWLHPADVMRFKMEVVKHLPVLLFGDRRKLTEGGWADERSRGCLSWWFSLQRCLWHQFARHTVRLHVQKFWWEGTSVHCMHTSPQPTPPPQAPCWRCCPCGTRPP